MKKILYWCVQISWGFLQTTLGFLIFLIHGKCEQFTYRGAVVTRWDKQTSLSLGPFLFVAEHLQGERYEHILHHEFGHTIQSLVLGPLYLVLIGLPSVIWCNLPYFKRLRNEKGVPYDKFFIEGQASRIGKRF